MKNIRSSNKGNFPWELLFLTIGLIVLGAWIAKPEVYTAGPQSKKKSCVSNMKTIEGAVELLRMEDSDCNNPVALNRLVNGGYLKTVPQCPSGGQYSIYVPQTTDEVCIIKCNIHKTIDDQTSGL